MSRPKSNLGVPEIESKVLRWTFDDITTSNLYKKQVGVIPMEFSSTEEYLQAFRNPLLEMVRAQLHQALDKVQRHGMTTIRKIVKPNRKKVHEEDKSSKKIFEFRQPAHLAKMKHSDLVLFCSAKPRWNAKRECLVKPDSAQYLLGCVVYAREAKVSAAVFVEDGSAILTQSVWHVVLPGISLTPAQRVWQAISERFEPDSLIHTILRVDRASRTGEGASLALRDYSDSRSLNESQREVVLESVLAMEDTKPPHVRMVQGPPGTGKTAMLVTLISVLACLQNRTLVSAPTNAAVVELAKRVMRFFDANHEEDFFRFCARTKKRHCFPVLLSDVILLGSKERLQGAVDGTALERIFLHSRIARLEAALSRTTGWKASVQSAVTLLTTAPALFEAELSKDIMSSKKENQNASVWRFARDSLMTLLTTAPALLEAESSKDIMSSKKENQNASFWRFARDSLVKLQARMRRTSAALTDELPQCHMDTATRIAIASTTDLMAHLVALMPQEAPVEATTWFETNDLGEAFRRLRLSSGDGKTRFMQARAAVLETLKTSPGCSLFVTTKQPKGRVPSPAWLWSECLKNATLVFSTVSGAGSPQMMRLGFACAIVDEASQLVEAETAIVICKKELKQLILVGDHKQLPATVISKVAEECGYKRSLFDRLQTLQHGCRHMLNVQYRMKPTISKFPNFQFYGGRVEDGPNVMSPTYGNCLHSATAFGAYAFLDCRRGVEELQQKSWKNSKEVEVVTSLVAALGKVCAARNTDKLSVGVISPYKTQVEALKQALNGHQANLQVEVKTVDGFQGNERDVIIFSAVRSNHSRKIGFVEDCRRLNVAITRGRYCVWIVGNAATLSGGGEIWNELVADAKARNCFHAV